jgi:NitT/TauT family transport system ATP-binding protein
MTLSVHIQSKRYPNGKCAIQDLRFTARPGEFVAIVGPSGSGKTTLLKIISSLDTEFDGSLQLPPLSRLGFMFQEPRLMPWLTVTQNLTLVAPQVTTEQLTQALERVGLNGCAALFPKQLSGGMQRRVALLRAFLVEPQLLLMDEPFQSLDLPTADQLRAQLHSLWQEKKPTVLFVTHNLAEALALADRVLFLSGSPSRVALDFAVDAPRPRGLDSRAVQGLTQQLLQAHPDLLKGALGQTA